MVDQKRPNQSSKQPPKKDLKRAIAGEMRDRIQGEISSRQTMLKSSLRSRLEQLLPKELQWVLPLVENFRRGQEPAEEVTEETLETVDTAPDSGVISPIGETLYRQYRCWNGDPLSCHFAEVDSEQTPTSEQAQKTAYCAECGFPKTLAETSEIRGSRGRYRVDRFLRRRGMGRLYAGTYLSDGQPIVIKEYLLPSRTFNEQEMRRRKTAFVRLAGVDSVDGKLQDYRLVVPWEAIADETLERCYLISRTPLDTYPTLRTYLARSGAMTEEQVRFALNQILQTLEFLHGQKVRLPSGRVQPGIAHGNLSLESLLIAERSPAIVPTNSVQLAFPSQDFTLYVCDLSLWESLFIPTPSLPNASFEQDLRDVGYVAFYLLTGYLPQPDSPPFSASNLDPKDDRSWGKTTPALKQFVLRLMELDTPFASAETARQALLKLPSPSTSTLAIAHLSDEEEPLTAPKFPWWIYGGLGVALLGLLLWWVWRSQASVSEARSTQRDPLPCCMNKVPGVPKGEFTYTAAATGTWSSVLLQPDLIVKGRTLAQELAVRQPKLQLSYRPEPTSEQAIAQVRADRRDFAITTLSEDLTADLAKKEVAYDGLAVFVAFSYARRDNSLPQRLNGEISLEQLQKLYTGQVKNWRELGGPDLPVKLYVPIEAEAIRVFEQRVLKTDQNIAQFRSLLPTRGSEMLRTSRLVQRSTFDTLRDVIQDFEADDRNSGTQSGAIAFGTFSNVFGQCSVYPLAIKQTDTPVQALVQDSGKPIDPTTDLCRNKGSYRPQVNLFKTQRYPLAYPLVVVYPHDNSRPPVGEKFADILRTQEGQHLLQQTGLVPIVELGRAAF